MKKIKKVLSLLLYYSFASHLPNYSFPGGFIYNKIRVFLLRGIFPVGKNCRVMRKVYIGSGKNISIGANCRINENVRLCNVKIGNHVMIARDTVFLGITHNSERIDIPMEKQGNKSLLQGVVQDDVWIGLRCIIMPSLNIAKGTILGAGGVLTKSTEVNSIYAGVPAKKIKERGEQQ